MWLSPFSLMCQVTSLQEGLTRQWFNQQQLLVASLFFACCCHLSRWSWNGASRGETSGENTRGGRWHNIPSTGSSCVWGSRPLRWHGWRWLHSLISLSSFCLQCLHTACCCKPASYSCSKTFCLTCHMCYPQKYAFLSSCLGREKNETTASLILSVINLVYLHSNMNATEYTAKYHSKPECNCPWSQRLEVCILIYIKTCKYQYEHQIKQCNQEFQIQITHKNGVEIIIIINPLFKGFKEIPFIKVHQFWTP